MNFRPLSLPALLFILALAATAVTGLRGAYGAQPIDEQAREELERLYAGSPGARGLGDKAKAILVIPEIRTAGLIYGEQFGDGVMFLGGEVAGRYRVDGLLAGYEPGAQSYAYVLFFLSDAALEKLRHAEDWQIGADPGLIVVDAGTGKNLSRTVQGDVYGVLLDQKPSIGGVVVQGLKITRTAG